MSIAWLYYLEQTDFSYFAKVDCLDLDHPPHKKHSPVQIGYEVIRLVFLVSWLMA